VDLQIQTTQNPHTQAATRPSSNPHKFGDIKALVQQIVKNNGGMVYFA